jgi:lambda family phage minor tail protein L
MTTLASEIQLLAPTALIELFVLDLTVLGGSIFYFHSGMSQVGTNIVWQGKTYAPMPIEASGFEMSSKGVLPQPKISVANIGGLISAELMLFNNLTGAKVTRKRTHARFLDAVNFPNGNPTADPSQYYPDDVWFVEQKVKENKYQVDFSLSSVFDVNGVMLPYRQVVQNSCTWVYGGPQCSYTGAKYFDINDNPVATAALDVCGKKLSSCKCRFGAGNPLPYGGFPGAVQYDINGNS